jgi:membrane protease YdiL (CAAX protease family)
MNILYSITLKALCAGLLAAFLEEYLFRGLLFRSFSAFCRWPWAIGFSSLIFAWLHFRAPVDPSIPEPFWVLFWRLLIGPFNQPLELPFQLPFLNLLLLGSFLSFIYHYRYRLIVPIAFHWSVASACLAFKKISFTIFDNFVIGSNRITDGLLTTALLLGLNLWGYLKIKKTSAS